VITREADYAIRAILHLASRYGKSPISTTELGEETDVPYRFLRKISRKLIDAKLIDSQRGKFGGIYLCVKPETISIYDILQIFDSKSLFFNSCLLKDPDCKRIKMCPVHQKLKHVQLDIDKKLKSLKFSDLIESN
jgi:Rrf2 family protein